MNRDQVVARLTSAQAQKYIDQVGSVFKNIPHLPKAINDILVQIVPWLVAIGGVMGAVNGIQYLMYAFGVRTMILLPGVSNAYWLIVGVQQLVSAYLSFLAFPLLRAQSYNGWAILFWNAILMAVVSVLIIFFIPASLEHQLMPLSLYHYSSF